MQESERVLFESSYIFLHTLNIACALVYAIVFLAVGLKLPGILCVAFVATGLSFVAFYFFGISFSVILFGSNVSVIICVFAVLFTMGGILDSGVILFCTITAPIYILLFTGSVKKGKRVLEGYVLKGIGCLLTFRNIKDRYLLQS